MDFGKKVQAIVIGMREDISMIRNQDSEYFIGPLVMFIRETMKMIKEMDMGRCFGLMVLSTRVNGKVEFNKVKVYISWYLG